VCITPIVPIVSEYFRCNCQEKCAVTIQYIVIVTYSIWSIYSDCFPTTSLYRSLFTKAHTSGTNSGSNGAAPWNMWKNETCIFVFYLVPAGPCDILTGSLKSCAERFPPAVNPVSPVPRFWQPPHSGARPPHSGARPAHTQPQNGTLTDTSSFKRLT